MLSVRIKMLNYLYAQCLIYRGQDILIIKAVQVPHFKDEVSCLKGGTIVHCNSKLFGLCPIIDDNGVMRVGGRLDHASTLSYIEKHPIVMPWH